MAQEEVVKQAERLAEDIVEEARAREREIRLGAEDYADRSFRPLEVNLQSSSAPCSAAEIDCRDAKRLRRHRLAPNVRHAPRNCGARCILAPAERRRIARRHYSSAPCSAPSQTRSRSLASSRLRASWAILGRPDRGVRAVRALGEWGTSPAGAFTAAAIRAPGAIGLIDERGQLTYREIHLRVQRAGPCVREPRRCPVMWLGPHGSQPPGLRRGEHRRRQAGRARALPQHDGLPDRRSMRCASASRPSCSCTMPSSPTSSMGSRRRRSSRGSMRARPPISRPSIS